MYNHMNCWKPQLTGFSSQSGKAPSTMRIQFTEDELINFSSLLDLVYGELERVRDGKVATDLEKEQVRGP